jgi:hypothetical protein
MRKTERFHLFDKDFRMLNTHTCFEDVTVDGSNTVFLIPESKIDADKLDHNPGNRSHSYSDPAISPFNRASDLESDLDMIS